VIDEYVGGRLSRRDFVRVGAMFGLSLPVITGILSASKMPAYAASKHGGSNSASLLSSRVGQAGATINAGILAPSYAPNPLINNDPGAISLLSQVGEMLVYIGPNNVPKPWLATSWSPNASATVWTFKIRQGVKFSDGTPMTVDDVVYTFQMLCDPKGTANSLSLFAGVLVPAGVVKVDAETVAFHLEAPYGAFPAATASNANYNGIIVPNNTNYPTWGKTFIGTGPFMMKSFNQTTGASFVKNPAYWGTPALPAAIEMTFFTGEPSMAAALESGAIDCLEQFTVSTSPQLLNGDYNVTVRKSSAMRECSMRNDVSPFTNKYVRQAVALTLDRPAIVKALFKGYAAIGNDNPFAPSFPESDLKIPQRKQNLKLAKQLLHKAGLHRGFHADLYTEQLQEIPQLAQIIKASAAKIGVDITLHITTDGEYYGQGVFGKSNWLDGEMSLVDFLGRAVPDVLLQAPLQSRNAKTGQGSWNAAHFKNPTYDKLSKEYVATADLSTQRKLAGKIETLLLDETPIILPYFYDYLAASRKNVYGVNPEVGDVFYLNNVTKG
jgi:peptide/nickel transport system substrate-binding protein